MQSPHIPTRKHDGSRPRQRLLHSCRLPKLAELAAFILLTGTVINLSCSAIVD